MVLVNLTDKLAHKGRTLSREVVVFVRISTQVVQCGLSVMYNQLPVTPAEAYHIRLVKLPIQMVVFMLPALTG